MVTFNMEQQRLIEDLLDEERRGCRAAQIDMTIYEFTASGLDELPATSFEALALTEHGDIQRVLREHIRAITPGTDTMVLAEEFGSWQDARRRSEKSIEQEAAFGEGRDYTRHDVRTPDGMLDNLPKRRFVHAVVAEALKAGLSPDEVCEAVPWRSQRIFISASGRVPGEEIAGLNGKGPRRYFLSDDELFRYADRTYALNNQWGPRTEEAVRNIIARLPVGYLVTYKSSAG